MKKKNIIRLIICLLALSLLLITGGCGADKEEAGPVINPIEVSISIHYPSGAEQTDVADEIIKIEEDSTVLDALQIYCNISDVPVTIESNSRSVHGINGIDKENSPEKSWQYKLNGELSSTPPSEQVLVDGDSVEWVFKKVPSKSSSKSAE